MLGQNFCCLYHVVCFQKKIYLFKVAIRKRCKIYWKLTIKTPEGGQWRLSSFFRVSFEYIFHLFLVFLLLHRTLFFCYVYFLESWAPPLPFIYSCISLFGALLLLSKFPKDRRQIQVLASSKFKQIKLYSSWNHQNTVGEIEINLIWANRS